MHFLEKGPIPLAQAIKFNCLVLKTVLNDFEVCITAKSCLRKVKNVVVLFLCVLVEWQRRGTPPGVALLT